MKKVFFPFFLLLSFFTLHAQQSGNLPDTIRVRTITGYGVEGVQFGIFGPQLLPLANVVSDSNGLVINASALNVSLGEYDCISGMLDTNARDGISLADALLISRHILGIEPLLNPYLRLAADVNGSGSITTFDIFELEKLLLGQYSEWPNVPTWRILNSHFDLGNLGVFYDSTKLQVTCIRLRDSVSFDYIAFKMGDIDLDGIPNHITQPQGISVLDSADFVLPDLAFAEGDTFEVILHTPAPAHLGIQLGLQYDEASLSLIDAEKLTSINRFKSAVLPDGLLNMVHYNLSANSVTSNAPFAKLRFKALKSGKLRELINLSPVLKPMALKNNLSSAHPMRLVFSNTTSLSIPFPEKVQVQVSPNPASEAQRFEFYGHPAGACLLNLYSADGKLISAQQIHLQGRGVEHFMLPTSTFPHVGVYHYQIQGAHWHAAGTLLRQ
ncbi:MAG: hypothetical protein J0L99_11275 [Chitinophagales bacterium]|nr:hypothetical protein [Chitinophagales bacterium]